MNNLKEMLATVRDYVENSYGDVRGQRKALEALKAIEREIEEMMGKERL